MPCATGGHAAAGFDPLRPRLIRVACRMLGSVDDAEDVVQEAFIRSMAADRARVRQPKAFLRRTVTRPCLDQIRSARRRREAYVGPWLPDPVVGDEDDEEDDVTLPLMLALERLSPPERAAFLLCDVFGLGFAEVAATVDRAAACRQLAARAQVRDARPRYRVDRRRGLQIAHAFFEASRSGDKTALGALLAADVSVHSDRGGKRQAAVRPLFGFADVMKVHEASARLFGEHGSRLVRVCTIDGLPGLIAHEADGGIKTTALEVADARIVAIYVMRNPNKLGHLH